MGRREKVLYIGRPSGFEIRKSKWYNLEIKKNTWKQKRSLPVSASCFRDLFTHSPFVYICSPIQSSLTGSLLKQKRTQTLWWFLSGDIRGLYIASLKCITWKSPRYAQITFEINIYYSIHAQLWIFQWNNEQFYKVIWYNLSGYFILLCWYIKWYIILFLCNKFKNN